MVLSGFDRIPPSGGGGGGGGIWLGLFLGILLTGGCVYLHRRYKDGAFQNLAIPSFKLPALPGIGRSNEAMAVSDAYTRHA